MFPVLHFGYAGNLYHAFHSNYAKYDSIDKYCRRQVITTYAFLIIQQPVASYRFSSGHKPASQFEMIEGWAVVSMLQFAVANRRVNLKSGGSVIMFLVVG